MTQITLDPRKTIELNAATYFERAKKCRKKSQGARAAILRLQQQFSELQKKQDQEVAKALSAVDAKAKKQAQKKEWYEKFHWFISSDGFLCVGGRDATSNEIVVKKHTDKTDVLFHTEAPGSPFFVVKSEGKAIPEDTLKEVAEATALYSKAWKLGIGNVEVYWVKPEQVSKQAPSGEYMPKGGFMMTGKRNYCTVIAQQSAVGLSADGKIMGGPVSAVRKHCAKFVIIKQGHERTTACAKFVLKKLGVGDTDDVVAVIPAGGCSIAK